jgi:hypothetical protein
MSADWYFMKKCFFGGSNTVGPIAESVFVKKIQKGEIVPDTLVSSTTKTHGHWLHLKDIRGSDQLHTKKSQSGPN